jgi:hypothetical protein
MGRVDTTGSIYRELHDDGGITWYLSRSEGISKATYDDVGRLTENYFVDEVPREAENTFGKIEFPEGKEDCFRDDKVLNALESVFE